MINVVRQRATGAHRRTVLPVVAVLLFTQRPSAMAKIKMSLSLAKEAQPFFIVSLLPMLALTTMMLFGVGEAGRDWAQISGLTESTFRLMLVYFAILSLLVIGLGLAVVTLRWLGAHRLKAYVVTTLCVVVLWMLLNSLPASLNQMPAVLMSAAVWAVAAVLCVRWYWILRRPDLD